MNTQQISNQILNVGDYVLTSKGKIGVIESEEHYVIGFFDFDKFRKVSKKLSLEQWEDRDLLIDYLNDELPDENLKAIKIPNQVKLGNKSYPIWSDKLTKLDNLTIITQQGFSKHQTTLPIEDAKKLMDIYTRNKLWFSIR